MRASGEAAEKAKGKGQEENASHGYRRGFARGGMTSVVGRVGC